MWANFSEWEEQVHSSIKNSPLWGFKTYQKALFLADLAWFDVEKLYKFHSAGRWLDNFWIVLAPFLPILKKATDAVMEKTTLDSCECLSARPEKPKAGITEADMHLSQLWSITEYSC